MRLFEVTEPASCPRTKATDCSCDRLRQLSEAEQTIEAVAVLGHGDAKGMISFKQKPGKATIISGTVTGLSEGLHGLHIHEFGDLSDGCDSAGGHYNPTGVDHGDIDNGHVGDLGNITADSKGVAKFSITAKRIHLQGATSIVGRAVVVHAGEDDLGKGGDEESLKTGNAGDRAGCGVISLTELTESAIADLDKNISDKHFSRSEMPQIKEPDLEDNDISYVKGKISLDKIKPVQTDRVPGLAQKVAKNFHGKDKPFILDKNNYLVNGHHRYDAARLLGIDRVSVLKVDVPIELLMKKFSHTTSNTVVEDVDIDSLPDMGSNFPVQKQDIQNIQSVIDKKVPDIVPFDNKALVNTAKKKFPDATPGMQKNCEVISSMVAKKYGLQNPKPIIVMHEKRSGIGMCYHDYNGAGSYPQKGRGQITINWKANIIDRVVCDYFDEKGNRKEINVTGSMNGKDIHTLKENNVIHKNFGRDQSIEKQINPGEPQKAYDAYDGDYLPFYFSNGWELNLMDPEYSNYEHEVWVLNDANGKQLEKGEKQSDLISTLQDMTQIPIQENFADGKKKGKSRPGRVKRSGASCNGSVTALRKRAKNSSGEKAKMYHWCANMKSGKKKTNEDMDSLTPSAKMADDYIKDEINAGKIKNLDELKKYILELRLARVIEYAEDARALWVHHFTNNPHKLPNAVKEGNAFVGKIKRQFTNLELPTWMSHTSLEKLFAQDFGPRYGDYVAHMELDSDDDLAMSNQGMGDMAFELVKANDIKVMQKFLAQMPVEFTVDDLKLDDGVQVWHLVQQKKTVH